MTFVPPIVVCFCILFLLYLVIDLSSEKDKLKNKVTALSEKLTKHEIESMDSINRIKKYTRVGVPNSMPSPTDLAIAHICDLESRRLRELYNRKLVC